MFRIALTQALDKAGMEYLTRYAEPVIIGSGEPEIIKDALDNSIDGIICRIGKLPGYVIESARNLKVIGRTGVGYDDIDVKTASRLGIPIIITPGANSNAVAEYTIASMFAAAKGICISNAQMRKGNYAARFQYSAFELSGKTVLLIGFGNIGRIVSRICVSLGMTVYAYDEYVSPDVIREAGAVPCDDFKSILPEATFISLHVPLNDKTKNIIGEHEMALMQDGAIIINHARGGLVDEAAMIRSLESGKLATAALDVFENEPPDKGDPILKAPNVILSPHVAAQTIEAKYKMAVCCVDGMMSVLNGEKWDYVADKSVYNSGNWKRRGL